MKIINECDLCQGTGEVEILEYDSGDHTGHNTIVTGTDRYVACPECQEEQYDKNEDN